MKIVSTSGKGTFEIIDSNEKKLVELTYTNWFSSKASTHFKRDRIEILPKNIWQSKFDIFINGSDRGDITFNWKGHIILLIEDKPYLLKRKSLWKSTFALLDENQKLLLTVKPSLNWKKFKYDYHIQEIDASLEGDALTRMLLYVGFAANLYMARAAAAA